MSRRYRAFFEDKTVRSRPVSQENHIALGILR
jgi:hypothetical protein